MSAAWPAAARRRLALSLSARIPRRRRSLLMMQLADAALAFALAVVTGAFMFGQDGSPLPPSVWTGAPMGPPADVTCSSGCPESAVVASPVAPGAVAPAAVAASGVADGDAAPSSPPPQPAASTTTRTSGHSLGRRPRTRRTRPYAIIRLVTAIPRWCGPHGGRATVHTRGRA